MYCVVTGGTEGIGKSIIYRFAEQGFDIITCARNQTKLDLLKVDIERTFAVKVSILAVDVSIKEEVLKFGKFVNDLGIPEILINNAGVFTPGMIDEEADGALEMMINTNLYSAYHLTRAVLPQMKAVKKGYIFNICSIASLTAYANGGSYSISKFALYVDKEIYEDAPSELKDILVGHYYAFGDSLSVGEIITRDRRISYARSSLYSSTPAQEKMTHNDLLTIISELGFKSLSIVYFKSI